MNLQEAKPKGSSRALTLIEVLIIILLLVVLVPMLLPPSRPSPALAARIKCVNNLKNIGLAFRLFATDHDDRFPMELSITHGGTKELAQDATLVWMHFAAVSNELVIPKIILCPRDKQGRKEATNFNRLQRYLESRTFSENANVSYFVGIEASESKPTMILGGDRNITNQGPVSFGYGIAKVGPLGTNHTTNTGASWGQSVHMNSGSVLMTDGSVLQLTTSKLRQQLRRSGDANNVVAVPD